MKIVNKRTKSMVMVKRTTIRFKLLVELGVDLTSDRDMTEEVQTQAVNEVI